MGESNLDTRVVSDFGKEWQAYDQTGMDQAEIELQFDRYFHIFPWDSLVANPVGADIGCGSGRWARLVAPRVRTLHCIDASGDAIKVARMNLRDEPNCNFIQASVDSLPFTDGSLDFGYSLGVLHHVPDTAAGLAACVAKLRPGAPFLLYLYYALDNRPGWFRLLWKLSDLARRVISTLPFRLKRVVTGVIAVLVYYPLARTALFLEQVGLDIHAFPLSAYRNTSFYSMKTDALDRFGTRLEKRFTREEIRHMMTDAGLTDIRFSETPPYWCAVGLKKAA